MALLAEVSAGKTKTEILKALNVKDMGVLRNQVKALWKANYINTPFAKSTLANSLWLRDDINCQEEVLKKLATDYYASSFIGTMGSDEMNHELQWWTNQNTGGLLADCVKDLKLDPDTLLGLVSTLLFKAAWMDKFEKEETRSELFHGLNGDTQVQMMHASGFSDIFRAC
jgi:serpin B